MCRTDVLQSSADSGTLTHENASAFADEVKVYTIPARAVLPGVWDNTVAATYSTPTNPTNQTVGPVTEQETVLPTCAHFNADGSPFDCRTGTRLDPAQANNTTPNQANCCEVS